ncbi:hypothetical protein AYO44_16135 [Planctomycetaceae bacterium SCGC AG-212-F19]|nr:hypothetical protein AYO44_16135 [Planctomycetaceae bacterium SCGC AG-212-F19]
MIFLQSIDPVRAELASGEALLMPASSGVAIVLNNRSEALRRRLHTDGQCLGCFWYFSGSERLSPDPARFGIYVYAHLCENWIAGPYGRERIPRQPIHVDQLPPNLRSAVTRLCFLGLSFADTSHIQPVELVRCRSWEGAWLAKDGTTVRPIPGREESFGEVRARFGESPELRFEPPK